MIKQPFHNEASQDERRAALENDRRVGTYHSHAAAEAEISRGRFTAETKARVIGSAPTPASQYPAASAHQLDPCGLEPPFPADISLTPVVGEGFEVEESLTRLGKADPPSAAPDGGESVSSNIGRVSGVVESDSPPMRFAAVSEGAAASAAPDPSPPSGGGRVLSDDGAAPLSLHRTQKGHRRA